MSPHREPAREMRSLFARDSAGQTGGKGEQERQAAPIPQARGTANMPYAFKFLVSKVRDEVKAPDKDEPLKTRYAYIKNGTFVVATALNGREGGNL